MASLQVTPDRLPAVLAEAQRIARLLLQRQVDLNEVAKSVRFYVYTGANTALFSRYLVHMADAHLNRSRQTPHYYEALKRTWQESGRALSPGEKAYAWAWAVRLAQAEKQAQKAEQRPQSRPERVSGSRSPSGHREFR